MKKLFYISAFILFFFLSRQVFATTQLSFKNVSLDDTPKSIITVSNFHIASFYIDNITTSEPADVQVKVNGEGFQPETEPGWVNLNRIANGDILAFLTTAGATGSANFYFFGDYYIPGAGGGGTWINLPITAVNDLFASVGTLMSDLWILIAIAIGVPLAFYILKRIISLTPKK